MNRARKVVSRMNESQVVELSGGDGALLLNMRNTAKSNCRAQSFSRDDGNTWPVSKILHEGPAAYSCLAIMPDKSIGWLYECGETNRLTSPLLPLTILLLGRPKPAQAGAPSFLGPTIARYKTRIHGGPDSRWHHPGNSLWRPACST